MYNIFIEKLKLKINLPVSVNVLFLIMIDQQNTNKQQQPRHKIYNGLVFSVHGPLGSVSVVNSL